MARIVSFTFNPFMENTYVVYDESGSCIIVDPGCYTPAEQRELSGFIEKQGLQPAFLVNTHCHVDHVLGNRFVADTWKVPLVMHEGEIPVLHRVAEYVGDFGMHYDPSPEPEQFLDEGDVFRFGNTEMDVLCTPGHSPASICLYAKKDGFIVSGDVLFYDSIGRTDLPGGDYDTLITSIREKLLPLPDDVKVYAGHMQPTTIGRERRFNPFLNGTYV
ncbi:MAG: MBL fold metallo-hydrolase [Chitinophagales bacterium]